MVSNFPSLPPPVVPSFSLIAPPSRASRNIFLASEEQFRERRKVYGRSSINERARCRSEKEGDRKRGEERTFRVIARCWPSSTFATFNLSLLPVQSYVSSTEDKASRVAEPSKRGKVDKYYNRAKISYLHGYNILLRIMYP